MKNISAIIIGLFLSLNSIFSNQEGLSIIPRLFAAIILLLVIIDLKSHSINSNYFSKGILIFLFWALIGYATSGTYGYFTAFMTFVQISLLVWAIISLLKSKEQIILIFKIFIISAPVLMIINYQEIFEINSAVINDERVARMTGTFGNPNQTSIYSMFILTTTIFLFSFKYKKLIFKLFLMAAFIAAVIINYYSGSRKGIIGFFIIIVGIGIILYLFNAKTNLRKIVFFLVPIFFFALAFFIMEKNPHFNRIETMVNSEESSSIMREYLIKRSFIVWTSSPRNFVLGVGLEQFPLHNPYKGVAHATFAEVLVTTGLIGFLIFYSIIFTFYKNFRFVIKYKKYYHGNVLEIYSIGILLTIYLLFDVTSIVHNNRLVLPILGIFFTYLSLIKKEIIRNRRIVSN